MNIKPYSIIFLGLLLTTQTAHAYVSAADFMAQAIRNDGQLTADDFALPEPTPSQQTGTSAATNGTVDSPTIGGSSYISNDDFGPAFASNGTGAKETPSAMPDLEELMLYRDGKVVGTIFRDAEGNVVDPLKLAEERRQEEEGTTEQDVDELEDEPVSLIEEEENPIDPVEELPDEEEMREAAPDSGGMNMMLFIGAGIAVICGAGLAFVFLKKKSAVVASSGSGPASVAQPGATQLEQQKHDRMQEALANMRKS